MTAAEFEEREYESAALVELAEGGGAVFTPGQVMEKILGYDSVASPVADHILWQLLHLPRPDGLVLVPNLWAFPRPAPAQLPLHPVSVILQYKRPEYLKAPQAAQWPLWQRDYFRVTRTEHQHRRLRQVETRAGASALVRYAAPVFWRRGELENAHLGHEVLARSGFVAPSAFAAHRVWTYVGAGIEARFNPSGHRSPLETYASVASFWAAEVRDKSLVPISQSQLPEHLRVLAEAVLYRNPSLRRTITLWRRTLVERDLGLSPAALRAIGDYSAMATWVAQVGAIWFVAERAANAPVS